MTVHASADDFDDPEELTTVAPAPTTRGGKSIPFGSTLASQCVRVRLNRGAVNVTMPSGVPVALTEFPDWEVVEILRYVEWALEVRML